MEGTIFFYLLHCILRGSASNVDVLGIAEVQVCSWSIYKNLLWSFVSNKVSYCAESNYIYSSDNFKPFFVKELPAFGCIDIPRTLYEVIAQLANRLAQWDDKFWRFFLTKIRTHLIQTFNTSTFRSSAFEHCVHILYKGILLIFLEV